MSKGTDRKIEVSVVEAARLFCPVNPLIDIRTPLEMKMGVPSGAIAMTADEVLLKFSGSDESAAQGAYILCAVGVRSLTLVKQLRSRGLNGFFNVAGGFRAWTKAGLPTGYPRGLNAEQADRYSRHLVMPQIGPEGQRKLLASRMLLVGLGGLNSPAALYLAAAGVGTLGLVDDDSVERSNLQRQVIHTDSRIGEKKIRSAAKSVQSLNPEVEIEVFDQRVDKANAAALLQGWDIVIDGTDNFPARYVLNEACIKHRVPLVYAGVMRFQGQVSVFWPGGASPGESWPCFQCAFPQAPAAADVPGCAEAGVLGVLPGITGTLQANEALKLALGIGQPLTSRLLMFDALNMDFRQAKLKSRPDCPACGT
jgi:molybdopterin/thiamine biosynthesis adenylyltransferase/rhodanese-related sulfurtransferase